MKLKYQPKSILFHSLVHANLPVVGTVPVPGPNTGPVGREGFPAAGSRAESLQLDRANVALGSSVPNASVWELKRIEGCPFREGRGRFCEMPEVSGAAKDAIDQVDTRSMNTSFRPGSATRATSTKGKHQNVRAPAPSDSGSRNGMGADIPHGRLRPPLPSLAHRLWPRQIHGPIRRVGNGNHFGPSNLGGLRLMAKRPMATATGMATGNLPPRPSRSVINQEQIMNHLTQISLDRPEPIEGTG